MIFRIRTVWLLTRCVLGLMGGACLTGCAATDSTEQTAAVPLPTGHYEGAISYQGTELRVALELRETSPGRLQADLYFPEQPALAFAAARVSYRAPQLRLELGEATGITVQAVREGDFLRGVLNWQGVRSDFVWVRRGAAIARSFREQQVTGSGSRNQRLLLPDDTVAHHPALLLVATPATAAAAAIRATYLARQGFATLVLDVPEILPDSVVARTTAAALGRLRRQTGIDSSRVGYWGSGAGAATVAAAAGQAPQPAFAVLESVPVATEAAAAPYRVFSQKRIPTLVFYAGLDTITLVAPSVRRLRAALGPRQATVRLIPDVTPDFLRPGRTLPDGQWQWPQPAPAYWEDLPAWLRQR